MIVLLSPTKTFTNHTIVSNNIPLFMNKSNKLINVLKDFTEKEVIETFKVSETLGKRTYSYFQNLENKHSCIYLYGGTAFKHLDPISLPEKSLENVYIFSALYGLLNAFDAISPYRLDFTNNIIDKSLYAYWGSSIDEYLKTNFHGKIIINLASKEYSDLINLEEPNIYTITFVESKNNKDTRGSMMLKKMRGLLTRHILKEDIKTIDQLLKINLEGFTYSKNESNSNLITFRKGE